MAYVEVEPAFIGYNPEFLRRARAKNAARARRENAARLAALAEEDRCRVEARRITKADKIINRICRACRVSRVEMTEPSLTDRVVFARHAAYYWLARRTTLSLKQIGAKFNRSDHTTILRGAGVYPAKRAAMGRTLRQLPGGRRA